MKYYSGKPVRQKTNESLFWNRTYTFTYNNVFNGLTGVFYQALVGKSIYTEPTGSEEAFLECALWENIILTDTVDLCPGVDLQLHTAAITEWRTKQ